MSEAARKKTSSASPAKKPRAPRKPTRDPYDFPEDDFKRPAPKIRLGLMKLKCKKNANVQEYGLNIPMDDFFPPAVLPGGGCGCACACGDNK